MPYSIPLTTEPSQTLTINLNNIQYSLAIKYNYQADMWSLTMSDLENNILVEDIPMMVGRNLLAPHKDLQEDIGQLWMIDNEALNKDATAETLGESVFLVYYPPDEEPILPFLVVKEITAAPTFRPLISTVLDTTINYRNIPGIAEVGVVMPVGYKFRTLSVLNATDADIRLGTYGDAIYIAPKLVATIWEDVSFDTYLKINYMNRKPRHGYLKITCLNALVGDE